MRLEGRPNVILPIYLLGCSELREVTKDVANDSEDFQQLIDDMLDTMHGAKGIGLAAPQVGRLVRLFVIDVTALEEDFVEAGSVMPPQPMIFVNPEIIEESSRAEDFEEGCLSIPDIHEVVVRPASIRIKYLDRTFEEHEEAFGGMLSRVIQHEIDHLEGILFLDHLTAFKRRLLKRKLDDIRIGSTEADYPVYTKVTGVINPEAESKALSQ